MGDELARVTVGVGIPTCSHERAEVLARCLDGISAGSRRPERIVVSVDSNPELARHLAGRPDVGQQADVEVVDGRGVGVSEARNKAAALLGTDIVLFVDDDVRPHGRWLERMVAALVQPGVAAVGGRVLPDYESRRRRLPPELLWLVGCTYAGHADGPGPISRPIGAAMGFWRHPLLAVGGFDARFGPRRGRKASSNEELELSARLRRAYGDEAIRYEPHAVVLHSVPEWRCTWRYLTERCWVEGVSKRAVTRRDHRVLGDDRRYLLGTLVPALATYARRGDIRGAAMTGAAGAVTAAGFLAGSIGRGSADG